MIIGGAIQTISCFLIGPIPQLRAIFPEVYPSIAVSFQKHHAHFLKITHYLSQLWYSKYFMAVALQVL